MHYIQLFAILQLNYFFYKKQRTKLSNIAGAKVFSKDKIIELLQKNSKKTKNA